MTTDPLRDALAEALLETGMHGFLLPERVDAILAHPAVLAALDRSDPAVGLHDRCQNIAAQHFCDIHWNDASLAATPTASPTEDQQ